MDPLDRLILPPDVAAARRRQRSGVDLYERAIEAQEAGRSWIDLDLTMPDGTTQKPVDLLVTMARMLRDGRTLSQIRAEVPMARTIPNHVLERAIVNVGLPELNRRIDAGEEPAESRHRVDLW